ncbi:MAG TPA: transglycosylase domain-containing protein [Candidatus Saccharimonadales bacterium]
MAKNSSRGNGTLRVYSNLSNKRKAKADARARRKAEYLATLPKHPVKRLLYRLHPRRVVKYWFSREGGIMALKIVGVTVLVLAILAAGVFAYVRKDLDAIRPEELAKRVQTTVTKYLDRNGQLLWEDNGGGDYKIVVDAKDINDTMRQATISIEDKDFYKHGGISFTGIARSVFNNAGGGETQGASTLTQQLVRKVFFTDEEASQRSGLSGYMRKIKEAILAIEVERMYSKDQILNLYLNQVPYGGPRNGVAAASRAYFGVEPKNLSVAQAALLAAIPQSPGCYNPYTQTEGCNQALLNRQKVVINNMREQGYITKQQASDALKEYPDVPTLQSKILPLTSSTANMKAPHFLLTVKSQLEKEFGSKVMGDGGLTIKTTLDIRAQNQAEAAVQGARKYFQTGGNNIDNMSLSSVDVETGQVIAMVGSVDFNDTSINGQTNYATAELQPGSSIKPFDYATLFKQRPGVNYGPGSVFQDRNIKDVYCRGNTDPQCELKNFTGRYYGAVTIREALGNSLNTVAVQAMHIAGTDNVIETAREAGDASFCKNVETPGLSAAIGGGCLARPVEHANAFATFARGGVAKPLGYVMDVKNAQGQTLKQWKDESKQVLDPQVAYMVSDSLTDPNARLKVFGTSGRGFGFVVPDVKTASKTGTSDNGKGKALDQWMMSYSTKVATAVWSGRHDGSPIGTGSDSTPVRRAVNDYMSGVHKDVYMAEGKYKANEWFNRPAGIQDLTVNGRKDIWPSWYRKPQDADGVKMIFDKISKKKATQCTPERAKQEVLVQKIVDPTNNKQTLVAPDGFDANADDDRHRCEDAKPFVTNISAAPTGPSGAYKLTASVTQGTNQLQSVEFAVNGQVVGSVGANGSGEYSIPYTATASGSITITATVIDSVLYDGTFSKQQSVTLAATGNEQRLFNNGRSSRWQNKFARSY